LAKWEAPLPTYLNQSTWSKFLVVAKEFPMHWVVHNMYCLPLVLASIVPVLVAGLVSRTLIAQLPHFSGTWSEFEKSKDVGSEKLLTVTLRALQGQIGIYSTLTTLCFVLWAHKIVKPIALRVILPGFLTACTVTTLDKVYAENNGKGLPGYLLIQLVVHGTTMFTLFYQLGQRLTGQGCQLFKMMAFVILPFFIIVVAYDVVIFPNLGEWDDPMKAIFCVVVNPLIWEFPLTIGRATARVLPYNHSSTSYFLIVMVVAGKKATGRFVLATIKSEVWISVASVLLALVEVVFTMTVAARDRGSYRVICGDEELKDGSKRSATEVMKLSKNLKLRVQWANVETTLEIVFIFMGLFFLGHMRVASMAPPERGATPSVSDLVVGGLIQYFVEMFVDFANISYLTAIANQPYLEYSHLHHKYWIPAMCVVCFFASSFVISNSIPNVIYRISSELNGGHESDWVWIMDCVEASNATYDACAGL